MSFNLSSFALRLLNFNSSLCKARSPEGSLWDVKHFKPIAKSRVKWFECLSAEEKRRIQIFITNVDTKYKIDAENERTKHIYTDIETIMRNIVDKIVQKNQRLKGTLVKMGSAFNGLKIKEPNEFDFTYEMDISDILDRKTAVRSMTSEKTRMLIYVDFEEAPDNDSDFDIIGVPIDIDLELLLSLNGNRDALFYKSSVVKRDGAYLFNAEAVSFALFETLWTVVSDLNLPPNWSHGGYNYPQFSGLRLNIPAFLLQFVYNSPEDSKPLMISVDFAPVLKLPDNLKYVSDDAVDQYLSRERFINYHWQRLERGMFKPGYNSLHEETWLSTYSTFSVPKITIRACKSLHDMALLSTPKYISKHVARTAANARKIQTSDKEGNERNRDYMMIIAFHAVKFEHLKVDNDYATFLDIYENFGQFDFVSSYIFKRTVMMLMALDKDGGRHWTEADIPDIVMNVYMFINDMIMFANKSSQLAPRFLQIAEWDETPEEGLPSDAPSSEPANTTLTRGKDTSREMEDSAVVSESDVLCKTKDVNLVLQVDRRSETGVLVSADRNAARCETIYTRSGGDLSLLTDCRETQTGLKIEEDKKGGDLNLQEGDAEKQVDAEVEEVEIDISHLTHLKSKDNTHAGEEGKNLVSSSPFKWYDMLVEAVQRGKGNGICGLFQRKQYTQTFIRSGLEHHIARVMDLLRQVSARCDKARIKLVKTIPQDWDDEDGDIEEILITRQQLRQLLSDS